MLPDLHRPLAHAVVASVSTAPLFSALDPIS
jgi:hypothetical protein